MAVSDTIYRESYFKGTPFFHEEIPASRLGVSGDPVPYTLASDDIVTTVLLICLLLTLATVARSWHFLQLQTKALFRPTHENTAPQRETAGRILSQTFFFLEGIVLLGLLSCSAVVYYSDDNTAVGHYTMLGIFCAIYAGYYVMHSILKGIVHAVFFEKRQRRQEGMARQYFMTLFVAALLPLTLLHVYLQLSVEITLEILAVVLLVPLLLHFCKVYTIFFSKKTQILQFFLYLCTVEAVPLALLGGVIFLAAIYLTQNI